MAEMTALQQKWAKDRETDAPRAEEDDGLDPKNLDQSVIDRLPKPTGWRLLVLPFRPPKKTKSGLYLAEQAVERQQVATVCGYVIEVGPLAYSDQEKFPTGAWCEKGDWIVFARYAGARLNIEGGEIRILNDDEVLARISDPADLVYAV